MPASSRDPLRVVNSPGGGRPPRPTSASRFTAWNESLIRWLKKKPAALRVRDPAGGGAATSSLISSNGPSKPSRTRSNLHAHLKGQRIAGRVVGPDRRPAGISEVVGMVLRLEHVEHMGAKRLGALHDVGTPPDTSCPATSKSAVARWTWTPVPSRALTNLVAVRKSGWSAGKM